ncbi:MAG: phosphatidylglycerol lysyltransferase domain-containing protein [Candidatus Moduliflexus flocculans]|nr:phosphatidylglycerol lysyltransferase domain-containing protein [Candidatus Moduliflexus flocculans]
MPEDFVARYGAGFQVEEDRGNFDYVYSRPELAELKGKKYDGKRNRIRKFEIDLRPRVPSPDAGRRPRLRPAPRGLVRGEEERRSLHEGREDRHRRSPGHLRDRSASRAASSSVGGRIEAFTMGGRLTSDTVVIPIEIANPGLVGLAQWINREFVRREWADFAFVNREQDMNVEGLRKAKLSYQPVAAGEEVQYHAIKAAPRSSGLPLTS